MSRNKADIIKKMYPEYMPAVTEGGELKLFFNYGLIKNNKNHVETIKNIEKQGFVFNREVQDITGDFVAFFKEIQN